MPRSHSQAACRKSLDVKPPTTSRAQQRLSLQQFIIESSRSKACTTTTEKYSWVARIRVQEPATRLYVSACATRSGYQATSPAAMAGAMSFRERMSSNSRLVAFLCLFVLVQSMVIVGLQSAVVTSLERRFVVVLLVSAIC